ncbi:MAG TPA: alpha/beta hydrolase, partial [Actinomycetota bacterium]|nr:alpha/beta hydrolase [Actinomycetota bacterium]
AAGPTIPRECRTEHDWTYRPGQFAAITAPTLFLAGSESPPPLREATRQAAAAIPGSQIRTLHDHGHLAYRTDPAEVAAIIRQFVAS